MLKYVIQLMNECIQSFYNVLKRSKKFIDEKKLKGKSRKKTVVFLRNAGKVYILQDRSQKNSNNKIKQQNKRNDAGLGGILVPF